MRSETYCMDCMEALKDIPDKYFGMCIADPPYGLNITGRHRSKIVQVERERERGERQSSAVVADRLEEKAHVYGESRKALANQRFILCSMTAPHRTQKYSGSWKESVRN